jgi:N-acetylneuraminic acid mutarotase
LNTDGEKALVCGGFQTNDENDTITSDACYIYNAASDKWTANWTMNIARAGHGMSVYKGKVYVYGGWNIGTLASIEVLSYTARNGPAL